MGATFHDQDGNVIDAAEWFSLRREAQEAPGWEPIFSPWRHGGWYVDNLRYPSGAVGCVSRNYADRKWRIACDPRPFESAPTFPNRRAAALGERDLIMGTARLEYLRGELRGERISYGELAELQDLIAYIDPEDVEMLEAAGVSE